MNDGEVRKQISERVETGMKKWKSQNKNHSSEKKEKNGKLMQGWKYNKVDMGTRHFLKNKAEIWKQRTCATKKYRKHEMNKMNNEYE